MRILVTGAAGFLGRYIVSNAITRGHQVRAQIRPVSSTEKLDWINHPRIEIFRADLRSKEKMIEMVMGIDTVVHAALSKQGGPYSSLASTLVGTENLLEAMRLANVTRLVQISSFTVYNYLKTRQGNCLDESCEVEIDPMRRDYYCTTKLLQERLVHESETVGIRPTIVRPGAIFGREDYWTDRIGVILSPRAWILIGGRVRIPLTYVENCAEAIVMCAETEAAVNKTFNIVDDETPTQWRYAHLLRDYIKPRPRTVLVPWVLLSMAARFASGINRCVFHGKMLLPQILRPPCAHARFKPLRYSNHAIKKAICWRPQYSLEEALGRCFEEKTNTKKMPNTSD